MKINNKALSTGKSLFLRVIVVLIQVRSGLYGIPILQFYCSTACGLSSDYLGQVAVESLTNCTRGIPRHHQLHGPSGDNALDSECKLLLARAGKAPVFLDIISKINSHMHIPSST